MCWFMFHEGQGREKSARHTPEHRYAHRDSTGCANVIIVLLESVDRNISGLVCLPKARTPSLGRGSKSVYGDRTRTLNNAPKVPSVVGRPRGGVDENLAPVDMRHAWLR